MLDQLCKLLVAERSYRVLAVPDAQGLRAHGVRPSDDFAWPEAPIPELAPLTAHFERILVRSERNAFDVICIKSRLNADSRRVTLDVDELRKFGEHCLGYTTKIHGTQLPVTMQIWEVCDELHADTAHLRELRCTSSGHHVEITAWSLRLAAEIVWTNARFNGRMSGRAYVESLLARLATSPTAAPQPPLDSVKRAPVLTFLLVAAIAIMFALQLALGKFTGILAPTTESVVAFGGLERALVQEYGQWYRLFSCAFLHGNPLHLILNSLGLYIAGARLESMVGRAWLMTIFALSALGGSAASLLINDASTVSVGASDAIMGMFAALLFLSFSLPYGQDRSALQARLRYWLVPALLPLVAAQSATQIDYAGHLGGALTGGALGWALLSRVHGVEPRPASRGAARFVAAGLSLAIVASLGQALTRRADLQRMMSLAPLVADRDAIKKLAHLSPKQIAEQLAELRANFPRDPRTSFLLALQSIDENDPAEAERLLRAGLTERELLDVFFPDGVLEVSIRGHLAHLLLKRGEQDEARRVFRPACSQASAAAQELADELAPEWVASVCR